MLTEANTCRTYVLPKLYAAGWNDDQISEQKSFTDGRIIVVGATARRGPQKRADYLLRYRLNLMLAVVEAKAAYKKSRDGLQQAKEYARILDLQFAYATNGHGIVEHDFLTGRETDLDTFPFPQDLERPLVWHWLQAPQTRECINRHATGTSPTMKKISQGPVMAIPFPSSLPLSQQRCFVAELDALQAKVDALKRLQAETAAELDALRPSIIDRAFKGAL